MRDAALLDAATLAAAEQRMAAAAAAIRTNRSTMRERHELSSHPWADPISSRMSYQTPKDAFICLPSEPVKRLHHRLIVNELFELRTLIYCVLKKGVGILFGIF
jgi:hypothetical protein